MYPLQAFTESNPQPSSHYTGIRKHISAPALKVDPPKDDRPFHSVGPAFAYLAGSQAHASLCFVAGGISEAFGDNVGIIRTVGGDISKTDCGNVGSSGRADCTGGCGNGGKCAAESCRCTSEDCLSKRMPHTAVAKLHNQIFICSCFMDATGKPHHMLRSACLPESASRTGCELPAIEVPRAEIQIYHMSSSDGHKRGPFAFWHYRTDQDRLRQTSLAWLGPAFV